MTTTITTDPPAATLARLVAAECAANKQATATTAILAATERDARGAFGIPRLRAERALPDLRLRFAEEQERAIEAKAARLAYEPTVRAERAAYYRPLVLAKVKELDAALAKADAINLELQRLGQQARADHGAAAFWCELAWREFRSLERDINEASDCRLMAWRRCLRKNGWL